MSGETATRTKARGRSDTSRLSAPPTSNSSTDGFLLIHVRCFPADDRAFRTAVDRSLARLTATTPDEVAHQAKARLAHLRHAGWPRLRIRVADRLASPPDEAILYVFRDGSVTMGSS
jgi:hypothetical protein